MFVFFSQWFKIILFKAVVKHCPLFYKPLKSGLNNKRAVCGVFLFLHGNVKKRLSGPHLSTQEAPGEIDSQRHFKPLSLFHIQKYFSCALCLFWILQCMAVLTERSIFVAEADHYIHHIFFLLSNRVSFKHSSLAEMNITENQQVLNTIMICTQTSTPWTPSLLLTGCKWFSTDYFGLPMDSLCQLSKIYATW